MIGVRNKIRFRPGRPVFQSLPAEKPVPLSLRGWVAAFKDAILGKNMPGGDVTVVIDSKPQKWRLECPEGHKNWRVWDSKFSCVSCHRQFDIGDADQSVYDELVDTKTDQRVSRDQVILNINAGQPVSSH